MRQYGVGLLLALVAGAGLIDVGQAIPAAAGPYGILPNGYVKHPYHCCPYKGNYEPYGVYYRPFPPYFKPYVSPPWGWGYTQPPQKGMGIGVY